MNLNNINLDNRSNKNCRTIADMWEYLSELEDFAMTIDEMAEKNLIKIKKTYKFFTKDEYNKSYDKLLEERRDIKVIIRKIDILEVKLFDCLLPDHAECFYFRGYLEEICQEVDRIENKYSKTINNLLCRFYLIEN